jgi:hypothetical protein
VELGTFGPFTPSVRFPDCPAAMGGYPLVPEESYQCGTSIVCNYDDDNNNFNGHIWFTVYWLELENPQKGPASYCTQPIWDGTDDRMSFSSMNRKVGASIGGWSRVNQGWARQLCFDWIRRAEPVAQPCGIR